MDSKSDRISNGINRTMETVLDIDNQSREDQMFRNGPLHGQRDCR